MLHILLCLQGLNWMCRCNLKKKKVKYNGEDSVIIELVLSYLCVCVQMIVRVRANDWRSACIPYHSGSEGNVVYKRGGQRWDPHDQNDGDGQTLILWHCLGEKITIKYVTTKHTHTQALSSLSVSRPIDANTKVGGLQTMCSWHSHIEFIISWSVAFINQNTTPHMYTSRNKQFLSICLFFIPILYVKKHGSFLYACTNAVY